MDFSRNHREEVEDESFDPVYINKIEISTAGITNGMIWLCEVKATRAGG